MSHLILIRHGASKWNEENRFTGWVDIPLSEKGLREAKKAGVAIKNISIDVAFTSKLVRAHQTLFHILMQQNKTDIFLHTSRWRKLWSQHEGKQYDKKEIPIYSSDKLNERYYGKLQGLNKDETRKKYGKEQVHFWRRGWAVRPPEGESLKDVYKRVIPYFKKNILPQLQAGKNVLVSAHGNSLRALVKFIDEIKDEDIHLLNLDCGKPVIYTFKNNTLTRHGVKHSFLKKKKK